MELPLFGVGGLPTSAGQGDPNSNDSTQQVDDFICGVECDPSSSSRDSTVDWEGIFDGPTGFVNSTIGGYQLNQTPQLDLVSMNSFYQLTSTAEYALPTALVPANQPVTNPIYSNQSSLFSYEEPINASI